MPGVLTTRIGGSAAAAVCVSAVALIAACSPSSPARPTESVSTPLAISTQPQRHSIAARARSTPTAGTLGSPSAGVPPTLPPTPPPPLPPPSGPPPRPSPQVPILLNDDLDGRLLFPSSNWWNQDISAAPVDPRLGHVHRFHRPHETPAPGLRSSAVRHPVHRRRRKPAARADHLRAVRKRERCGVRRHSGLSRPGGGQVPAQLH